MIDVLLVEDDQRYRASVETLLRHSPGFAVAAAFGLAGDAIAWAAHHACTLAVVDLQLPDIARVDLG